MPGRTLRGAAATALIALALPGGAAAEAVSRAAVEAALPQLRAMAEGVIAAGGVPGLAIVVVHQDEVVFLEGFGVRKVGAEGDVDGDTVFQIASMSKPMSSTVVARLVGEGVLDWDSRIADLWPEFQLHDPYPTAEVTVRDLFNHRSGLPGNAGNDLEDMGYGRDHVMHQLRLVAPSSSFRAGYAYSNAGITAGALAAVRPTGEDWETAAETQIFGPLGMTATSYRYADFLGRENAAALHVPGSSGWEARILRDASTQAPAGGVSSSARDLGEWMRLQLAEGAYGGAQLIDKDALAATHAPLMHRGPNPITGAASFYGLGWNVEFGRHGLTYGHAGAFSVGGRTLVTLWPEAELGVVVLANAFPTGAPEGLSDSFADLVFDGAPGPDFLGPWNAIYASLFGPAVEQAIATYAAAPDPATPALPAGAYAGTYANAYAGPATVTEGPDGLTLALGPDGKRRFALSHFDRDIFLYYPDAETPTRPSTARFAIGPDGQAVSVELETFADNGWGLLARQP